MHNMSSQGDQRSGYGRAASMSVSKGPRFRNNAGDRSERWEAHRSRSRNHVRSTTNHATINLDSMSLDTDSGTNNQEVNANRRQQTRSSSPKAVRSVQPKLSYESLPSFKKRPGRTLQEQRDDASRISGRGHSREMEDNSVERIPDRVQTTSDAYRAENQPSSSDSSPITPGRRIVKVPLESPTQDILEAISNFQGLLDKSQENSYTLERQLGALYKRFDKSQTEANELKILNENLRRNMNMLIADRKISLDREEKAERKLAEHEKKLAERDDSIKKMIDADMENRRHQKQELETLRSENDMRIQELKEQLRSVIETTAAQALVNLRTLN